LQHIVLAWGALSHPAGARQGDGGPWLWLPPVPGPPFFLLSLNLSVTLSLIDVTDPHLCAADSVGAPVMVVANNAQPSAMGISNFSGQPFVTIGGGALPLPLPMPAEPATLTATRVATKAMTASPHAMHTSCLAVPLVARCRQCVHCFRRLPATSKETVSVGTQ
jgi:hypothetical protein